MRDAVEHRVPGRLARLAICGSLIILLSGCERGRSTPTAGTLTVGAGGPGFALAIEAARVFAVQYPEATIHVRRLDGFRATEALIGGDIGLALLPRAPVAAESAAARDVGVTLTAVPVAVDGVAILTHAANPLERVRVADVRRVWSGQVHGWEELGGRGGRLLAFAPDPTTGTGGYLAEVLGEGRSPGPGVYFQMSDSAVVAEVQRRPDALGLVSVGYLVATGRPDGVRIVPVARDAPAEPPVRPSQATLAEGEYPLTSPISAVTRGAPEGLAAGFLGFLTSDGGQRIVERLGLAPVSQASYEVHLR